MTFHYAQKQAFLRNSITRGTFGVIVKYYHAGG